MNRRQWLIGAGAAVLVPYVGGTGGAAWELVRRPNPLRAETRPTGFEAEELRISTSDGLSLGAWLRPGKQGTVLLLHGYAASRTAAVLQWRPLWEAMNVGVMAISLRGHGDSSGDVVDFHETRMDVLAAVQMLEQRFPHQPIRVLGISLGAGAALMAGPELGERVTGYMVEAPYKDLGTAARNRLELALPHGLRTLAYMGLCLWAPLWIHGGIAAASPWEGAAGIPTSVPVVILAGLADRLARPWEAQAIYEQVQSHGRLLLFPGADHGCCMAANPTLYWDTVQTWLK